MLLYHERWAARPAWHALSLPERIDYLDRIGPPLQTLLDDGATLLGAHMAESTRRDRPECYYQALWSMAGPAQIQQLHALLEQAGWHEYFASVDAGARTDPSSAPGATRGPEADADVSAPDRMRRPGDRRA